jgi:hypothetical protein
MTLIISDGIDFVGDDIDFTTQQTIFRDFGSMADNFQLI